ncbi:MAG: Sec-independent protein translocase protein TatB [Pseudomonadota bacterium]
MLDIGWSELLLVAIVAIIVVGPKDLPKLMRTIGIYAGKVRRMAADFQRQFNEVVAESEADEVRKNLESIRANMGPAPDMSQPIGKPLMTGPEAPQAANYVQPPASEQIEPALPEAQFAQPAVAPAQDLSSLEQPADSNPAAEKTPAKKRAPKKATARKRTAKQATAKKSPAKRPRKAKKAPQADKNSEPQP